jgi:myo-inositol-1(or 4)-monophosphatase
MDTSILDRAIVFAVNAHQGTERRGKGFPYIVHPMEAVEIVATMTTDQELLAAAVLHDTVEDTDVTLDDIRREFGERVAKLVEEESDVFIDGVSEADSWHERKQAAIDRLAQASRDAKMVALGDKLSNARIIYRDFVQKGDELWNIFHVTDVKEHEWHYRGLAESLKELEGTFAYSEFTDLINKIFGDIRDE